MMDIKLRENKDFSFNEEDFKQIEKVKAKYPTGREASAVIDVLYIAQKSNNGWVSKEAIEAVASVLNMAPIRVYEVASFYTMINLKPVGENFIQVCTTTPCWLRGSDEIVKVCKEKLQVKEGQVTEDGKFSYQEVECLGACANAPMVQINDDYYEDLNPEIIGRIIEDLKAGKKINIGSQIGRKCSEPYEAK